MLVATFSTLYCQINSTGVGFSDILLEFFQDSAEFLNISSGIFLFPPGPESWPLARQALPAML